MLVETTYGLHVTLSLLHDNRLPLRSNSRSLDQPPPGGYAPKFFINTNTSHSIIPPSRAFGNHDASNNVPLIAHPVQHSTNTKTSMCFPYTALLPFPIMSTYLSPRQRNPG